jgi:hypothetical protein
MGRTPILVEFSSRSKGIDSGKHGSAEPAGPDDQNHSPVNTGQSVMLQDQFLVAMMAGLVLRLVQLREGDIPHLGVVKHLYQHNLDFLPKADPGAENLVLAKTVLTKMPPLGTCYTRLLNMLYPIEHYRWSRLAFLLCSRDMNGMALWD